MPRRILQHILGKMNLMLVLLGKKTLLREIFQSTLLVKALYIALV
jgi:hypothetical protein